LIFIIVLFFILLTLLSRYLLSDKLSKTIISFYLIWWAFWLSISTLNLYELYQVSTEIYFLLLLNTVMVLAGFMYGNIFQDKKINSNLILDEKFNVFKNKLFTGLLAVILLILLYYFLKFRAISSTSLDLRMERFIVGELFSSVAELYFFNYFIEAFIYALYTILAYLIIYNKTKNIIFIMYLLCLILYAGIGSGRGPILYLLVAVCLIYFIRNKDAVRNQNKFSKMDFKRNKKYKTRLVTSLLVLVPGILVYAAWLTAVRAGYNEFSWEVIKIGFEGQFKQLFVYYTGPFRALEFGLEYYTSNVGFLFGRGTFGGIDELINTAINLFGLNSISANVIIGGLLQNNTILIGDNVSFRYAYTSVMIHYFDLGIVGVIIFPFIFGLFVRKSIFMLQNNPTLPSLVIVVFLFQTMIFSVFSWGLQSPSSIIIIVSCYLFHKYSIRKKQISY
jgi:oligosaccharide repeat unit polymerase